MQIRCNGRLLRRFVRCGMASAAALSLLSTTPVNGADRTAASPEASADWTIEIRPLNIRPKPVRAIASDSSVTPAVDLVPVEPFPVQPDQTTDELLRAAQQKYRPPQAAGPIQLAAADEEATAPDPGDGMVIEPAIAASDRLKYLRAYWSIPFRRAEYNRNPLYRHDAAMELVTGHPRPAPALPLQNECHCHCDVIPALPLYPPSIRPGYRPWSRYPWH